MANKCILILVDGMRPDALTAHPFCKAFVDSGAASLSGRSVMPSVTLPCHLSLFHSVPPERHGTLTNTYMPQVRPVRSLMEVLHSAGRSTAMFYNWEELRDVARPGSLGYGCFLSLHDYKDSDRILTSMAVDWLEKNAPDFTFLYLGETDEAGHRDGWMTEGYLKAVHTAWDCIQKVAEAAGEEYSLIVTADHGGHERSHGTDLEEDMSIPLLVRTGGGAALRPGVSGGSLLDIAPTVCALLGVQSDRDWEGVSLV